MATGKDIMTRAGVLLSDEEHVRWPLPELADHINEAVKAILIVKPSASPKRMQLPLVVGTLQTIVPTEDVPAPIALVRIERNLKPGSPPKPGRAISPVDGALLDAENPDWQDGDVVTYRAEARHFIFTGDDPLSYRVYPGNDGTGLLEALVSVLPPPLVADGDPDVLDSYGAEIGLLPIYDVPLLDFVCYRAQLKDAEGADPGRAMVHYTSFANALGVKVQTDAASSPSKQYERR